VRTLKANLIDKLPTQHNKRFKADVKFVSKVLDDFIEQRIASKLVTPNKERDLLDVMLVEENAMTKDELRCSVSIFFVAGHETAAAFSVFAKYPELQEIARAEVDKEIGTELPNADNVKKLVFLEMFIKEVMRFYGIVMATVPRVSAKETWVDDVCLPAGTILVGSIYAIHHSQEFWFAPEKFDPYRFSAENMKGREMFSYLPFSLGKRHCIGQNFAMTELKIIFCMLLQRFVVHYTEEPKLHFTSVTTSFDSVKVRLEKRRKSC